MHDQVAQHGERLWPEPEELRSAPQLLVDWIKAKRRKEKVRF